MAEATGSATKTPTGKRDGYFLVGIGLLLIGSPVVSAVSWLLSVASGEEATATTTDGSGVASFRNHALVRYWRENHAYWRVLTFLPAVLVICICHWVSLRIYLRR